MKTTIRFPKKKNKKSLGNLRKTFFQAKCMNSRFTLFTSPYFSLFSSIILGQVSSGKKYV